MKLSSEKVAKHFKVPFIPLQGVTGRVGYAYTLGRRFFVHCSFT